MSGFVTYLTPLPLNPGPLEQHDGLKLIVRIRIELWFQDDMVN